MPETQEESKQKRRGGKPRKPRRLCLSCGKTVSRLVNVYCNNKCQQNTLFTKNIREWKEGIHSGMISKGNRRVIAAWVRKYIFSKYEGKCSLCGWNEINPVTGKSPLEVDHINGNPFDSVESNLTLLCPNCHSLTSTYKGLNRGNGRGKKLL